MTPVILIFLSLYVHSINSMNIDLTQEEQVTYTLQTGTHEIQLNGIPQMRSVIDIASMNFSPLEVSYTLLNESFSYNLTRERFLFNYFDNNGTLINYQNISISQTFQIRVYVNNTRIRFMYTQVHIMNNNEISPIILGLTTTQIFQYNYEPYQDIFGRWSNYIILEIFSETLSYLRLKCVSNGVLPYAYSDTGRGRPFGNVEFDLPRNSIQQLQQESYPEPEVFFFEINSLMYEGVDDLNVQYRMLIVSIIGIQYMSLLYSVLFIGSGMFLCVLIFIGGSRCISGRSRRRRNVFNNIYHEERFGVNQETKIELRKPDDEEYRKRRESIPESETCLVCLDYRKCIKFDPCNHICCCEYCSIAVLQSNGKCPLCRAEISSTEKIVIPEEELKEKSDGSIVTHVELKGVNEMVERAKLVLQKENESKNLKDSNDIKKNENSHDLSLEQLEKKLTKKVGNDIENETKKSTEKEVKITINVNENESKDKNENENDPIEKNINEQEKQSNDVDLKVEINEKNEIEIAEKKDNENEEESNESLL